MEAKGIVISVFLHLEDTQYTHDTIVDLGREGVC